MAEPTCVMHPFSFTPPEFSGDPQPLEEDNPMFSIGDSISFGRYMSDNLEWEKWSSFNSDNRNRYVQEAEKYSKPGSVKQKKAYFEAHFKRMEALKAAAAAAAALLEQSKSPEVTSEGLKIKTEVGKTTGQDVLNSSSEVEINANTEFDEFESVEKRDEDVGKQGFVVHQNDLYHPVVSTENDESENVGEIVESIKTVKSCNSENVGSSVVGVKDETCNQSNDDDQSCGITQRDKLPLQRKVSFSEEAEASASVRKVSFSEEAPASASIVKKKTPLSSYMSPTVRETVRTPAFDKPSSSIYPGKENYATPIKKKSSVSDSDKKRTPLRMSINREINRIISPVIRKIGSSSKAPKDCSSPLNTAAKIFVKGITESPRMTPSRGARSHLGSSPSEYKVKGGRWHIFSTEASMSPSTGRHRISSPIIPSSFCLTGDRAAKRKQKLEDKFNATVTERAPQTSKFKEKAEAELNKFRQSFCFKAMSSPDHYREDDGLKSSMSKEMSTQGDSPKRGRQPNRTTSQSKTSSLPPRRPTIKRNGTKSSLQKN